MPFLVAKKLNFGEITPTSLSLQMENRSRTFPKGIIEDVLVKVDKFIFLVDFVVLDMEKDKEAPIKVAYCYWSSTNRCEKWRANTQSG